MPSPTTIVLATALLSVSSHPDAVLDRAAISAPPLLAGMALLQDDVDAFMERVLERREVNWEATYDYVFNEVEMLRIGGTMDIAALQSFEQEYTWYVRDGYLVRSPWAVNGVQVAAEKREEEELEWIADIEREEDDGEGRGRIERDSFFNFEFEAGNYFFAGRETFEGHEVVKIEYYPTNLFADDDDEDMDEFDHMFDKTSLVTMLIVPDEYQVVKWTFANVGFEFLPYRWLFRMDELHASMTMHQPIEGVWLPHEIAARASASTASANLTVEYRRVFDSYKEPAVGAGVVFGRPKR